MIEVKGLVKYYGERRVLHELDFSVAVGRICGFLGPNGSGKSTTMDIISGLLGPSAGDAFICGFSVLNQTKQAKACIGYLPDNPPIYEEMRVDDYVEFVGKLRGLKGQELRSAVIKVLDDCDVASESKRIIGHLSKGYKQRVALCAALVHNPAVLVLDEPTEGLDPTQIVLIRNLIKKLSKDRTVIMSSHILSEVQATCDDVIIINQGKIVARTSLTEERERNAPYLFTFAAETEKAFTWLQERSFVKEVTMDAESKNSLLVNFSADFWSEKTPDNLAKMNKLLLQNDFQLVTVQEKKFGIEEMFFKAINSNGTPMGSSDIAQANS